MPDPEWIPAAGRVIDNPVSGERITRLGRRTSITGRGETVVIPPRTTHWFGNAGPEQAIVRVEIQPALRTEELFAAAEALARAGQGPGLRLPRLSDLALFLLEFQQVLAVPNVPTFITRAILVTIAWLARRRTVAAQPQPFA